MSRPIARLSLPGAGASLEFLAPIFSLMDALEEHMSRSGGSLHVHTYEGDGMLIHDFYDHDPPNIPATSALDVELDELVSGAG